MQERKEENKMKRLLVLLLTFAMLLTCFPAEVFAATESSSCSHNSTKTLAYSIFYLDGNYEKHIQANYHKKVCRTCKQVLDIQITENKQSHTFVFGSCVSCGYKNDSLSKDVKAGNVYVTSSDGKALYQRAYNANNSRKYNEVFVCNVLNVKLPQNAVLIKSGNYLYSNSGVKALIADVATLKRVDERIEQLEKIIEAADKTYKQGAINKLRRDNIKSDTNASIAEYRSVLMGEKLESGVREVRQNYLAKVGHRNTNVKAIQQTLYALGYKSQLVTGYYGTITCDNVAHFQIVNDLTVTGWVDQGTFSKLLQEKNTRIARAVRSANMSWAELENQEALINYLKSSGKQVVLGNFTDECTLLGIGIQFGLSFAGVDFLMDARDVSADFVNWEWSWSHARQTAIDMVAVIPVIGTVKHFDELGNITVKYSDKLSKIVIQYTDEFGKAVTQYIDEVYIFLRNGNKLNLATVGAGAFGEYAKYSDDAGVVLRPFNNAVEGSGRVSKYSDDVLNASTDYPKAGNDIGSLLNPGGDVLKGVDDATDIFSKALKYVDKFDEFLSYSDEVKALLKRASEIADKGFPNQNQLKKYMGPAGKYGDEACQWHHIVEQTQETAKRAGFPAEQIHNVQNIVSIPKSINLKLQGDFARLADGIDGKCLRDWLNTQPFEVHLLFGLDKLLEYGKLTVENGRWVFTPFKK